MAFQDGWMEPLAGWGKAKSGGVQVGVANVLKNSAEKKILLTSNRNDLLLIKLLQSPTMSRTSLVPLQGRIFCNFLESTSSWQNHSPQEGRLTPQNTQHVVRGVSRNTSFVGVCITYSSLQHRYGTNQLKISLILCRQHGDPSPPPGSAKL